MFGSCITQSQETINENDSNIMIHDFLCLMSESTAQFQWLEERWQQEAIKQPCASLSYCTANLTVNFDYTSQFINVAPTPL